MRRIQVIRPGPEYREQEDGWKRRRLIGPARCLSASPSGASIWMDVVELEPATVIELDRRPGDEALFVIGGALAVEGGGCSAGGAVVIEAGAACRVEAKRSTRLLHMGPKGAAPQQREAAERVPGIHFVGPRGTFEACEPGRETHFLADASCPTCDLWLLRTGRDFAYESPVHSHSRDELIHVLEGEIRLGSLAVHPGETLFIAADQPYRLRANAGGFSFVNYRSGPSEMSLRATGETIVENGTATGMTRVAHTATTG